MKASQNRHMPGKRNPADKAAAHAALAETTATILAMRKKTGQPGAQRLLAGPTITVDELAIVLGVARASAYAAVRKGEIESISIGKRLVVPTAPLRRKLGIPAPAGM
jgi:hypothetical protein